MSKTIAGLFDQLADAEQVMQGLVQKGFVRDHISIVTRAQGDTRSRGAHYDADIIHSQDRVSTATRAVAGGVIGGTAGLIAAAVALALPGVGIALAAGPALTLLVGAAAGAVGGGLIGGLLHAGISEEHAEVYAEGVRRGMTLLLVQSENEQVPLAARLMSEHHVVNMEERAGDWRKRGWRGFDVHAPPLTPDELTRERRAARANRGPGHPRVYEEATMVGPVTTRPGAPPDVPPPIPVSTGTPTRLPGSRLSDAFTYHELRFQDHAGNHYAGAYVDYRPAYLYGFDLAQEQRHTGRQWNAMEDEIRVNWDRLYPGTWDRYKEAIRFAWDVSHGVAARPSPSAAAQRSRD
jgi:hypothetical protein